MTFKFRFVIEIALNQISEIPAFNILGTKTPTKYIFALYFFATRVQEFNLFLISNLNNIRENHAGLYIFSVEIDKILKCFNLTFGGNVKISTSSFYIIYHIIQYVIYQLSFIIRPSTT